MQCSNITIKDLIPAYVEEGVLHPDRLRIEEHLRSCEDCRAEFSLLLALADEPVPDPGDEFWRTMPAAIAREIRNQRKPSFRARWTNLLDRFLVPRQAIAAFAMAAVLIVSWMTVRTTTRVTVPATMTVAALSEDDASIDPSEVDGLDNSTLDSLDRMVNREISTDMQDVGPYLTASQDVDLDDELAVLNSRELDRLSGMMKRAKQEG